MTTSAGDMLGDFWHIRQGRRDFFANQNVGLQYRACDGSGIAGCFVPVYRGEGHTTYDDS